MNKPTAPAPVFAPTHRIRAYNNRSEFVEVLEMSIDESRGFPFGTARVQDDTGLVRVIHFGIFDYVEIDFAPEYVEDHSRHADPSSASAWGCPVKETNEFRNPECRPRNLQGSCPCITCESDV